MFFFTDTILVGNPEEGGVLGIGLDHEEPTIGVVDADVPIDAEKVLGPDEGIEEVYAIKLLEDADPGVLEVGANL